MSNTAKNPQDTELNQNKAAKPRGRELSTDELVEVTGGKVTFQDISFTKKQDKASPDLMM